MVTLEGNKAVGNTRTRSRVRRDSPLSQSQSQSQGYNYSQSQSQNHTPSLRRSARHAASQPTEEPSQAAETGTYGTTVSNATLPSATTTSIKIHLALSNHVELTPTIAHEAYVRGQEFLSDGWRRDVHREGRLRDRREEIKAARAAVRLSTKEGVSAQEYAAEDTNTLWYTAGISYPCVCSLRRLHYAYTPVKPPPASSDLHELPPHSSPRLIPPVGSEISPWSSSADDLDPVLDDLQDFECSWRTALATRQSNPIVVDGPASSQDSEKTAPVEAEQAYIRKLRKGKFRATDTTSNGLQESPRLSVALDSMPIYTDAPPRSALGALPIQAVNSVRQDGAEQEWAEEAKRRKKWWRAEIRGDPSYGRIWTFLPLPYSHPARYVSRQKKRKKSHASAQIPDFKLFRNYLTSSHPFHPDLPAFIATTPRARVHWLIPLHGPVLVSTLNHPLDQPSSLYVGAPTPSRASLISADQYFLTAPDTKPPMVRWTRNLLMAFLEVFLHPLYLDESQPFGPIAYAFSGPKPDPFIDLPPARLLESHDKVPVARMPHVSKDVSTGVPTAKSADMSDGDSRPVCPEAGDHLRIYCDASHALALRTWLHNVRIPLVSPRRPVDGGTGGATSVLDGKHDVDTDGKAVEGSVDFTEQVRVFYKTRLALVGGRGEVLIVA